MGKWQMLEELLEEEAGSRQPTLLLISSLFCGSRQFDSRMDDYDGSRRRMLRAADRPGPSLRRIVWVLWIGGWRDDCLVTPDGDVLWPQESSVEHAADEMNWLTFN